MSSYSFGTEYGTDQINVGSDNIRDYLNANDSNSMHQINTIRDREVRLLKKLKQYTPTCDQNRNRTSIDFCHPNVYSQDGVYDTSRRRDIIDNIENNYYSGRQLRVNNCLPSKLKKKSSGGTTVKEGFGVDDVQYLQDEMEDLEKKNNMLVLFIFFLVIVVLVQYAKVNNDSKPMQLMFIPQSGQTPQMAQVLQSAQSTATSINY